MPQRLDSVRREIHGMKSSLDAIYARYERSLREVPLDLQQDLHLYICVRLSGYLEQLLHQAICAYIDRSASKDATNFALSFFRNAPNLTPKTLETLIARLGEPWEVSINSFLDQGNNRDELGTLLKIRNDTAHGRSYGGSLANVRSYKRLVDGIHRWVHEHMIDP